MGILIQPFSNKSIGDHIQEALRGDQGNFNSFQAAVAFVKRSGIQHIEKDLKAFIENGKAACIVVGVDLGGTSVEGLESLLDALGDTGELFINHDENMFTTFHPKVYFFEGGEKSILIIGSGNLTQGGLYSNDEGFAILDFDPSIPEDRSAISQFKEYFEKWCDENSETVRRANLDFVESLKEAGYIQSEVLGQVEAGETTGEDVGDIPSSDKETENGEATKRLFGRMKGRRRAPKKNVISKAKSSETAKGLLFSEIPESNTGFVMTLMKTDVGKGQTTPGKSRRSPEIFIPLAARKADPEFWGWDSDFIEDTQKPGKYDRMNVKMRIGGEIIKVNMMTWPDKHDFRLRSEALRSAGEIGDLIKIEKMEGAVSFDYYVEIIPKGSSDYDSYLGVCVNNTRNSERMWGYY